MVTPPVVVWGRRRRASRMSPWRPPRPSPASRSSPSTRCRCTGGWTSVRPSRPRPTGRGCRTTASTSSSRPQRFTVADYQAAYRRAVASGGQPVRARRRHRAVPHRRDRRARIARRVARDPRRARCHRRHRRAPPATGRSRPRRGRPHRSRQPAPHRPCPRGVSRQRPAVQLVRARSQPVPADRCRAARAALAAAALAERIEASVSGDDRGRPRRRGRACSPSRAACRRRPARRSATRS